MNAHARSQARLVFVGRQQGGAPVASEVLLFGIDDTEHLFFLAQGADQVEKFRMNHPFAVVREHQSTAPVNVSLDKITETAGGLIVDSMTVFPIQAHDLLVPRTRDYSRFLRRLETGGR